MKSSMKLAMILALTATSAFVGCSEDSGSGLEPSSRGGGAGKGGSAGSGGNTQSAGSTGSAGKGGTTASAGSTGNGGSAGSTGNGGSAGSTSNGGQNQGGATDSGEGGEQALGGAGGETAAEGGSGGAPALCELDAVGGAGGFGFSEGGAGGAANYEVASAVVLLDNVVVKNGGTTVVEWQFEDAADIEDSTAHSPGNWTRASWNLGAGAGAENTFFACGTGDTTNGSMRNVAPFTFDVPLGEQVYEVKVPFTGVDYGGYTVTADVKLVAGGCEVGPVLAELYAVSENPVNPDNGDPNDLQPGVWEQLTLTIDDNADFAVTGTIGLRLHTQACSQPTP